jgi:hypothetical protein
LGVSSESINAKSMQNQASEITYNKLNEVVGAGYSLAAREIAESYVIGAISWIHHSSRLLQLGRMTR